MARLKKKTKRRITQVVVIMLCAVMMLPIASYFLPADPVTESQIQLMNELAKANINLEKSDHAENHDAPDQPGSMQ